MIAQRLLDRAQGATRPHPRSRVTVELAPAIGGTTVRVTESPAGPWAAAAPMLLARA